jgi:hypothetical protein
MHPGQLSWVCPDLLLQLYLHTSLHSCHLLWCAWLHDILGVQVCAVSRYGEVYCATCILCNCGEFLRLVVTFGTPCDVVRVTERVDIDNVDVSWGQEKVLQEAGEHMPWIQEEEADDKVKDVCRHG